LDLGTGAAAWQQWQLTSTDLSDSREQPEVQLQIGQAGARRESNLVPGACLSVIEILQIHCILRTYMLK
jgi:hypothetical protein